MYDRFSELLQKFDVTPYKVSKETGVSQATLSDWKNGKSAPKMDKLQKIANYFGVSITYFTDDKDQNTPQPDPNAEYKMPDSIVEIIKTLPRQVEESQKEQVIENLIQKLQLLSDDDIEDMYTIFEYLDYRRHSRRK